jgi:tetratricopeptide (TPR) repeat protein
MRVGSLKLDGVCYEVREKLRMRVALFAASAARVLGVVAALAIAGPVASAQETQIPTLKAAAAAAPGDAEVALSLGRALRRAGHLNDAGAALRQARALAGNPAVALRVDWELERLQADRRDFVQANVVCKDLGGLPGAKADGHACLAAAQLVRQRATEALLETQLALATDPRSFEAKLAEGRAYALQLDAAGAESSLRAAIALRPMAVEPFVELGRVLERGARHDDALADLRAAVQIDPHGAETLFALASLLQPGPEKLDLLKRATDERPSYLEAWLALGAAHFSGGRLAEARSAATSALGVDAANAPARILLGQIALLEGRPDEAIQDGRAALQVMTNSAAATLLVADGEARKGEVDLALESYQAAWGLDHGDPTPLVHASEACHAASRDTSARAFGVKATQEFPKWGPAWAALGDALVGQKETQAARDAYRKALAADGLPNPATVQAKLAALR